MAGIRVVREGVKEGERSFVGRLFEVENAVLAFFDEEESLKLGTLTIAIPQFEGRTCLSSVILGERNVLVTKLLAIEIPHSNRLGTRWHSTVLPRKCIEPFTA